MLGGAACGMCGSLPCDGGSFVEGVSSKLYLIDVQESRSDTVLHPVWESAADGRLPFRGISRIALSDITHPPARSAL